MGTKTAEKTRKTLRFPAEQVSSLYEYVYRTYCCRNDPAGTYNNGKQKYIGFFGHVKLMEALIYLYKVTKNKRYLDECRKKIDFCRSMRGENGIDDWWSYNYGQRSNWIESNHLGILALVIYEYFRATGDPEYNPMAEDLMNRIPRMKNSGGAYVDGYDPTMCSLDDRCYLADNSEILAGWWACWKLTGKKEYRQNYEDIFAFFDRNFKTTPKQPELPAWLVGPKHVTYAEGTDSDVFCDQSHTTYSQFFIARDILLTGQQDQYQRLVTSVDWAIKYTLFADNLVGYNGRDDKMTGWSAYFAAHCYFAYCITGNESYFRQAQKTMDTIWSLQHKKTGRIPPILPVEKKINWRVMEQNKAGLGEIWQLTAILESTALIALAGADALD